MKIIDKILNKEQTDFLKTRLPVLEPSQHERKGRTTTTPAERRTTTTPTESPTVIEIRRPLLGDLLGQYVRIYANGKISFTW
jgi:hypothetical protein